MKTVFPCQLSLGSNLGDRAKLLQEAFTKLQAHPMLALTRQSPIVETAPWGDVEQPSFLNQIIEVETSLSPEDLLTACQTIETQLGRVRDPNRRFGPRTIDIDLLTYGTISMATDRLILPHPRLPERLFLQELQIQLSPI